MKNFLLAFIPVFVAVDALGVLPIFVAFTRGLSRKEKKTIVIQSIVTAVCVAVLFVFLGKAVFSFLGILMGDFMIAGGVILFCIALIDIVVPNKRRKVQSKELGIVPLGTPLIVGPAVLTTCLVIIDQYGIIYTFISVIANVLLAGLIFYLSDYLLKLFGDSGSKALSKVMSLLLAAIAVMMIRKGVFLFIS